MNTKANSAWTKYPNTPESDKQKLVWHVVRLEDGEEVEVLATDPSDALRIVGENENPYRKHPKSNTQIQTTAAMRRFNQAVESAEWLRRISDGPEAPELDLGSLHNWLVRYRYSKSALELKLAGEAVGYFKE